MAYIVYPQFLKSFLLHFWLICTQNVITPKSKIPSTPKKTQVLKVSKKKITRMKPLDFES